MNSNHLNPVSKIKDEFLQSEGSLTIVNNLVDDLLLLFQGIAAKVATVLRKVNNAKQCLNYYVYIPLVNPKMTMIYKLNKSCAVTSQELMNDILIVVKKVMKQHAFISHKIKNSVQVYRICISRSFPIVLFHYMRDEPSSDNFQKLDEIYFRPFRNEETICRDKPEASDSLILNENMQIDCENVCAENVQNEQVYPDAEYFEEGMETTNPQENNEEEEVSVQALTEAILPESKGPDEARMKKDSEKQSQTNINSLILNEKMQTDCDKFFCAENVQNVQVCPDVDCFEEGMETTNPEIPQENDEEEEVLVQALTEAILPESKGPDEARMKKESEKQSQTNVRHFCSSLIFLGDIRTFNSKKNPKKWLTERRYCCNVCGKIVLVRCTKIASVPYEEPSFPCNYCEQTFSQEDQRNEHKLTHIEIKRFNCSYCMKFFTTENAKISHEKLHKLGKHHFCRYCGKSFSKYSIKNSHELRHRILDPSLIENTEKPDSSEEIISTPFPPVKFTYSRTNK